MDHFEITTEQSVYLIDDNEKIILLLKKTDIVQLKVKQKNHMSI